MVRQVTSPSAEAAAIASAMEVVLVLAPRLFRPHRDRLAEARAVVAEHASVHDAWRGLAIDGLIPPDWVNDEQRRFGPRSLCGACDRGHERDDDSGERDDDSGEAPGPMCLACYHAPRAGRLRAHPASRQACARLAADVAGVRDAEALAREAARRFGACGVTMPHRVLWRLVDAGTWRRELIDGLDADWMTEPPLAYAAAPLDELLVSDEARESIAYHDVLLRGASRLSLLGDDGWSEAATGALVTMLLTVVAARSWATPVRRSPSAPPELLNPFEPLLELMDTGYLLEAITPDHLVLAAPWREPPSLAR